jgi:hypothetical protein
MPVLTRQSPGFQPGRVARVDYCNVCRIIRFSELELQAHKSKKFQPADTAGTGAVFSLQPLEDDVCL